MYGSSFHLQIVYGVTNMFVGCVSLGVNSTFKIVISFDLWLVQGSYVGVRLKRSLENIPIHQNWNDTMGE